MQRVTKTCDRCGHAIDGWESKEGTVGFYEVQGTIWNKYGRPWEASVCDSCMLQDEGYLVDYPHMRGLLPTHSIFKHLKVTEGKA